MCMNVAKRWALRLCVDGIIAAFPGCGSHEMKIQEVKEESLSSEQKQQFDRMKSMQAEVLERAGVDPNTPTNPQEYARKKYEEIQASQAAAKEGATPTENGTQ